MVGMRKVLVLVGLVFLTGSSLAGSSTAASEDLSGCWEGCWYSETSGHKGPLFATLTNLGNGCYRADFSGRFFRIIPFRYSVNLTVTATGDVTQLAGENYLGRRYGTFTYSATVTNCDFHACYTSCKDCGTFQMTRVCATTCAP